MTEILLVLAVGGGIVAVLFATFRGAAQESEERERGAARGVEQSDQLAELEERQMAVARSLDEIEADLAAGNLSEEDYESLRRRYEGEAALLARQLVEARETRPPTEEPVETGSGEPSPGRRASWVPSAVGWGAGAVAFGALAWLVMSTALRPRSEGEGITGSLPGQEMGSGSGMAIGEVDQERLAALERRVAEAPDDIEALNELGHLYLRLQRYPQLAEVTRAALELDPNNPAALTHLGMLLFSTEHPQGVMAAFDRALAVDPDFPEALQFKGMVAFMQGDYATAVAAWDRYLEVVPEEEVSPRIRAMLESARQSAGTGETAPE